MHPHNKRDFGAGMMFILLGAGFAWKGASYPIGSAAGMGPGFAPVWLGTALAVLGAIILARSFSKTYREPRIPVFNWRLLILCIGTLGVAIWLQSPSDSNTALASFFFRIGPPAVFSCFVLYLAITAALASGSLAKAMAMIVLGLLLSTVGTDVNTGQERFVFGIASLAHGIDASSVLAGALGIGLWAKLPRSPYRMGLILLLAIYVSFSYWRLGHDTFFIIATVIFGLAGYLWSRLGCASAPLLFALASGSWLEENFRRAMMLSRGNAAIFVDRPWSAAFLALALIVLALAARRSI